MDKVLTICGIIEQKQIPKSYFIENFPIVMDVCCQIICFINIDSDKVIFYCFRSELEQLDYELSESVSHSCRV